MRMGVGFGVGFGLESGKNSEGSQKNPRTLEIAFDL
jgi:hypothetical protein